VARLLYELKSAGAAFRSPLAQILQDFGYKSSKAAEVRGLRSLGQYELDNRWLGFTLPDEEKVRARLEKP
jgi:hypothetical protein